MKFIQTYSIEEYNFGTQTITAIVSDSFADLFSITDGIESDILLFENVKEDLSTKEDTFALDELSFSIDEFACSSENDKNLLSFILESNNSEKNRYISIYFGEVNLENRLFLGKIHTDFSGDDKLWFSEEFDININPIRVYKFKALTLNYSLLDKVFLTKPIMKNGTVITVSGIQLNQGLYSLLNSPGIQTLFNAEFTEKLSYRNAYFQPLGRLWWIVSLYLELSSLILTELEGTEVEYNLLESELGFEVNAVAFDFYNKFINVFKTKRLALKLTSGLQGEDWSSVLIHRRMIDPSYGNAQVNTPETPDELFANELYYDELPFSFKSLNTVTEIIVALAKNLGCFLDIKVNDLNVFNLKFINRSSLVEDDFTYLIGASEAKIDTSYDYNREEVIYYANANNWADDGISKIDNNKGELKYGTSILSLKYTEKEKKKLLLSSSVVFVTGDSWKGTIPDSSGFAPLNIIFENELISVDLHHIERIHTGIYVATQVFEDDLITEFGAEQIIFRPALQIYTQVQGKDQIFPTLSAYITYLNNYDKGFYQTEYDITIPYWNGFSKNTDGSLPKWSNLKKGSKILLSEEVKTLIDGEFINETVTREYVVVSITRSLDKPETKLKLQSSNRFAQTQWAGIVDDVNDLTTNIIIGPAEGSPAFAIENNSKPYVIEDGETIGAGEATALKFNGKIVKGINHTSQNAEVNGIALIGGTGGETINVIEEGQIGFPFYEFVEGKVFLRKSTGLNLSQIPLEVNTAEENRYTILGNAVSENTLEINIREYILQ